MLSTSPFRATAIDGNLAEASTASVPARFELGELWAELVCGRLGVLDHFFSAERSYLILSWKVSSAVSRPPIRHFHFLEQMLMGVPQKALGIDERVAVSTVAVACRQCLRFVGMECLPSKAPPLLSALVHASSGNALSVMPEVFEMEHPRRLISVTAPRLESSCAERLSPAEYDVLRQVVEGKSHAEIAQARAVSERTIANQLASVCLALRVSGRLHLINRLLRDGALTQQA